MAAGSRLNFLRSCRPDEKRFPCHKRQLSGNVSDGFRNRVGCDARLSRELLNRRTSLAHMRSSLTLDFEQVPACAHHSHSLAHTRDASTFAQARAPKLAVNQHEAFRFEVALDRRNAP